MFGFGKKTARCGVQIVDNEVRIAEIRSSANKIELLLNYTIELGPKAVINGKILDEKSVTERIAQAVKERGLHGAHVHLTIPTANVILRKSVFPSLKDKEIRNLIDVDLYSGSQLPFKNPIFDFIRLGPPVNQVAAALDNSVASKGPQKQEEFLVFATPAEVVESYSGIVRGAGLVPISVELAPLALHRLMMRYLKQKGASLYDDFILLNAEAGHADINIFTQGIPSFIRSIAINTGYTFGAEADTEDLYGRNLSIELGRILNYYKYSISKEQQDVNKIYLVGDSQRVQSLAQLLPNVYYGEIEIFPIESLLRGGTGQYDAYAVPVGLALKGA